MTSTSENNNKEKATNGNSLVGLLKDVFTPTNLIFFISLIVSFIISSALFKSNVEAAIEMQKTAIIEQKSEIKEVNRKVEKNKEDLIENKHRFDIILFKQEIFLEKLEEIKKEIKNNNCCIKSVKN